MGFATVFSTIAFIIIFLGGVVFFASVQRTLAQSSHALSAKQEQMQEAASQAILIVDADYTVNAAVPWTDDLYAEFVTGNTSGGTTVLGAGSVEIETAPYASSTYDSTIIDSGYAATNYTTISWTSVEPAQTNITFQARSGANSAAVTASAFTGPDGTSGTYYQVSGATLNSTLSGARYFQYRAYLNTASAVVTPTLQSVEISIQRPSGVISLNITNSGAAKLDPDEIDFYVGGVRKDRAVTDRTRHLVDQTGQALWDPDENITAYIFGTISGSTEVTAALDHARDSAVVS